MDQINAIIANPQYQPVLGLLKGARNGLVYGAKVRFPHALVMTLLFHQGRPWSQRVRFVYNATRQHALNLCKFVTIYKTALLVQRWLAGGKERKADTFFAGLVGGGIVFGERNAVNEQIVLYVVSRVITSFLPRSHPSAPPAPPPTPSAPSSSLPASRPSLPPSSKASSGYPAPPGHPYPKSIPPDSKVFSLYAALTWGAVMWLFRWRRETLHGGMVNSMQYLYLDSEVWNSLKTLLWHNKP